MPCALDASFQLLQHVPDGTAFCSQLAGCCLIRGDIYGHNTFVGQFGQLLGYDVSLASTEIEEQLQHMGLVREFLGGFPELCS